ncbi:MAG: bifunctional pyr operon transcriptional regulator/uracil phosphoribosyltransferase PyrR [Nitrospinaceae bacterium]|nr:MAG: bifunctional pyr operon transcriptional regulator/uracil phosphoribosyltransferase PyrR [Nitrospinaceae bacterium]
MSRPSSSVLNAGDISRATSRIAHEILEKNKGAENLILVGIVTRGAVLSQRLQVKIKEIEDIDVAHGILDITLYRDDLSTGKLNPDVKKTEIPVSIDGKIIVLCDDVLFTGRTIRAAIDALMDFGRPAAVQLAVLVDRGHRELPIRPDYVGKNIPTSRQMRVKVKLTETDSEDSVTLLEGDK